MRIANTFWLGSEVVTCVKNLVFEDRDSEKRGILFGLQDFLYREHHKILELEKGSERFLTSLVNRIACC